MNPAGRALREKNLARRAVRKAVIDGVLIRQPCEVCGATPAHGHHDDYKKPLAVRWLCPKHHMQHHRAAGHFVRKPMTPLEWARRRREKMRKLEALNAPAYTVPPKEKDPKTRYIEVTEATEIEAIQRNGWGDPIGACMNGKFYATAHSLAQYRNAGSEMSQ